MNASHPGRRCASNARLVAPWLLLALAACAAIPASTAQPLDDARRAPSPLEMRSLYLDGDSIGDHMVVVGERGNVLVSRDGGRRWTRAETPTRATLTGVALHESGRGFAVGHDAVILRSDDGGDTWALVHAAPGDERPLLDVWLESAERAVAVGAHGLALESSDGGDTWHARAITGSDRHLNQIAAAPSGPVYVAAESGRVFRSDDAARTWIELPSPYHGSFFGTLPVDRERVYVYGLRGHLFRSDDAGMTWRAVDTGTESSLTDGLALDDGSIAFTGMGGLVLSGPAGGAGLRPTRRADRASLAGALPARDGALVVFGELGVERIPREQLELVR